VWKLQGIPTRGGSDESKLFLKPLEGILENVGDPSAREHLNPMGVNIQYIGKTMQ
jgi:hypothetical protein